MVYSRLGNRCSIPPELPNSSLISAPMADPGTMLTYQCNPGYLQGDMNVTSIMCVQRMWLNVGTGCEGELTNYVATIDAITYAISRMIVSLHEMQALTLYSETYTDIP